VYRRIEQRGSAVSVRVILELNLKPEMAEAVKGGMKDTLVDTRAFEGCEGISVIENQDNPTQVLLLERWETREHYEAYLKWRTDRGDMDGIGSVSTEPYKVTYWSTVRG
jgi:quinol monooxygenase YgiN